MTDNLGGEAIAGGKMKSIGTQYWEIPNADATNESGFSGISCSERNFDGTFDIIGTFGVWWSSTEFDVNNAWIRILVYDSNGEIIRSAGNNSKAGGFSARCVKD